MKKVRVAIIGYGHLGKWHAQKAAELSDAELIAIVEVNKSNHAVISEAHPNVLVTDDLTKVLPLIDAAAVVTPTSFHAQVVYILLENGKHVFCEKPLCSTMEQAQKIENLMNKQESLTFQVGHSERFHKVWEQFRAYCQETEDGLIQLTRISPFKGRATDVDVVQDLMIHDIDLLFHLFNAEVNDLKSTGIKNLSKHWDHVSSMIELNKGNKAWVNVSRNSCTEERSLRVSDKRGELFIDLMRNRFELRDNKGEITTEGEYDKRDHLLEEHKTFYNSILRGGAPVVSLNDGVNAVKVVVDILGQL